VKIAITKITVAWAAAVITAAGAGTAIAAFTTPSPSPAATDLAKRAPKATVAPAALSTAHGAKICRDLNAWLTGAWRQAKPRFTDQMDFDESEAGYTALGNDLMTLDWNLVNFNSGALKNSLPNHYPVTGLTALQNDCAGYGVTVEAVG
jgi:hypothetical protein